MFETNLNDFKDIQIFARILIGENMEGFTMIFDSGSSTMWVASPDCWNCQILVKRFDPVESSTYAITGVKKEKIEYGTGTVEGMMGKDKVCVTREACISAYPFLLVDE